MAGESISGFSMRNRLAVAFVVVVFGCVVDGGWSAAQFAPTGRPQQQTPFSPFAPFPMSAPPTAESTRTAARPEGRTHARRHVARRHPSRRVAQGKGSRRKVAEGKEGRKNQREAAESKGYKRVSDLVNFPKFFPGLGIIFVKPETLPTGPFLCFDHNDRLVATVYMVPIKDIDDHKTVEGAGLVGPATGVAGPVDHVSFYFNPGHPGVDVPHYHLVIWHVSKKEEERVAQ
jgi:hypothetical protein